MFKAKPKSNRVFFSGHVNVAPRHLTAESGTLLSATLIHEVMHVLGFDPHAFAHFRDERKRRRTEVTDKNEMLPSPLSNMQIITELCFF